MLPYKHVDHVKEAARALNVLYVYDRSYEPYMVHWLFPLQIAFRDRTQHAQDHGMLEKERERICWVKSVCVV
jgi:hypothetical protein